MSKATQNVCDHFEESPSTTKSEFILFDGLCEKIATLVTDTRAERASIGATAEPLEAITQALESRCATEGPLHTLHLVAHGAPRSVSDAANSGSIVRHSWPTPLS